MVLSHTPVFEIVSKPSVGATFLVAERKSNNNRFSD